MTLSDKLQRLVAAPTSPFARRQRPDYPKGWEPGLKNNDDGTQEIVTAPIPELGPDQKEWREALKKIGVNIPEGYVIQLVEFKVVEGSWVRKEQGDEATTETVCRYKFRVYPSNSLNSVELDKIFERIDKYKSSNKRKNKEETQGDSYWLIATGDWQLGKIDGDGVEGTVDRILSSTDMAIQKIEELKRLKKWTGKAALALLGDCVEGFLSQNGSNIFRTSPLDMTQQVRLYRRLVEEMVIKISEHVDELLVIAVPGNHGETVRFAGKMSTRISDSWDVESIVALSDAFKRNKDFDHVKFITPEIDRGSIVLDLGGTVVAFLHGHQVSNGNMIKFISDHALNMSPVGDAHLVLSAHHHHLRVEDLGARTWIQVPAMESESAWWYEKKGAISRPGMVTTVVGEKRVSSIDIL